MEQDLNDAIKIIRANHAYADPNLNWNELTDEYRGKVKTLTSNREFLALLEQLVDELHDHHAHLNTNSQKSYRLVPSGLDVWVDYIDEQFVVTSVRAGSDAQKVGVRAGLTLSKLNGKDFSVVVDERLYNCAERQSKLARSWAARTLLAGTHDQKQLRLTLTRDGKDPHEFEFSIGNTPESEGRLFHKTLDGGIEYIRIENSLGDSRLVEDFDSTINAIGDAPGLILDLRNTPGGGNTTVARGLMGRLIAEELAYQKHEIVEKPSNIKRVWVEHVQQRGETQFKGKIVVLCGRWTGSMGEGIVIGLDAMSRATIVGTKMAGLRGATRRFDLPHSKVGIYLPFEKLFHVNGQPRENYVPAELLEQEFAKDGRDMGIETALNLLVGKRQKAAPIDLQSLDGRATRQLTATVLQNLTTTLESVHESDQVHRMQFQSVEQRHGRDSDEFKALLEKCKLADTSNLKIVTGILDEHGWLGVDQIGKTANTTLFLVLQHADGDRATQKKYLPLLRDAVANKKASPVFLAMLEDRIAIADSAPQVYGSQLELNKNSGKYQVSPVKDVANLEQRRAKIGLQPMSEYLKHWNLDWDNEKRRLEELEAMQRQSN